MDWTLWDWGQDRTLQGFLRVFLWQRGGLAGGDLHTVAISARCVAWRASNTTKTCNYKIGQKTAPLPKKKSQ